MMPQHTPTTPVCRDCDGFATVKVTLGGRDRQGRRRLVTAHCKACHGIGTTPTRFAATDWEMAA